MIEQLQAYIRGEIVEFEPFVEQGWVLPTGEVTERGQEVSGYQFDDVHYLQLGSDINVNGQIIPKGTEFLLVWADRSHRNRRNWTYTIAFKTETGKVYHVPIMFSPKHEVIARKLPLDILRESG